MIKHYVLSINPHPEYEWDRHNLRDPLSGQRPDLAALVAAEIEKIPGSYLVSVNLEVTVLEQAPVSKSELAKPELSLPGQTSEAKLKQVEKLAV
ncbi:MAG: hypothetical protein SAJ37_11600 [Oscillatoria sp. PMC 1068.18]|nr:hypothetical protein [Oscillatoria sp. PMC 1076.18]MEC4989384.1 hypothetical protein [Oscillatoria sp. PMC 1068.18]